jgi:hypothetical protein
MLTKRKHPVIFCILYFLEKLTNDEYQVMATAYDHLNNVMVFNTTFNNISAISWPSVLLVEETGVPVSSH